MFKKYKRVQEAEIRPLTEDDFKQFSEFGCIYTNDNGTKVSISDADLDNGSPKVGDMIARNPKMHCDQWLIAKDYFEDNFTELPGFQHVGHGVQQSTQYSHVFKEEDVYTDIDAVSFFATHDVRNIEKGPEERVHLHGFHTKFMNVLGKDNIIRTYKTGIIRDINNYSPKVFKVPVIQIEYPQDWWGSFALEESFKEYDEYFDRKLVGDFKLDEALLNWKGEPIKGSNKEVFENLLIIAIWKLQSIRAEMGYEKH